MCKKINLEVLYIMEKIYKNCDFNCVNGVVQKMDYTKNPVTAIATNKCSDKEPAFGGLFNKVLVGMYITKVIYQDPATIVFWSDGTKTTCKTQEPDVYSKETGLALCVLKKLVGGDQVANLMNDWIYDSRDIVDLKFVRYMSKNPIIKEENIKNWVTPDFVAEAIEEIATQTTSKNKKKSKLSWTSTNN